MIEKRISTNPLRVGEILPSQVKYLPDSTICECPECMIFNIINSYLYKIRLGTAEKNAIKEIEAEEVGNRNIILPSTLVGYVHYRLNKEYPIFSYLYTDDLIYVFYDMISI
jgi:hypothetical protein